ncbi:hypothetical protein Taro_025213 [Colocasia esculenta]|uniref:Maternal effect embryo arrest 22 n=1 Tax=Colocasia esculenta TaxID=4460 RepID=A0A843V2P1_COLES|nr:hypothetical protein [Colocasia esculenta]
MRFKLLQGLGVSVGFCVPFFCSSAILVASCVSLLVVVHRNGNPSPRRHRRPAGGGPHHRSLSRPSRSSLFLRSALEMAADVALDPQPANPCCVELKKRYLRLEEKRNALRQAVKLLEAQASKLQNENAALKEVCEEERRRADLAHQAKEKESDIKNILEKEIQDLKSKIASLQENGNLIDQDRNRLLETRILQGEAEIKRLKGLLQKEIKKAETEKKKVLQEKKKTAEAWELMKIEKSKTEEQKRLAEMERKKVEDMSRSLAKAKSEANEAREKVNEERRKAEAANKKVELERKKASREKKCADIERARVEEQVELVKMERKKSMDEKERADRLSKQLEEERKRRELQREKEEVVCTLQGVKSCSGNYKTKQLSSSKEDTEFSNMKLLKSKLKLQKNELKHAKRMAKLEKSEKQLLLQQLHLLKRDHFKFSHRLEMLINCPSYGIKGTDDLTKIGGSLDKCTNRYSTESQRKCVCDEHEFNSQSETKTKCTATRCTGPVTSHTWHLPQKCGGRATRSISGISSDLESPVGDSVGQKLHNSALCSTAVTYSDAPLIGSQGRSAFAVATSAKLTKDSFQRSPSVNLTSEPKTMHVAQQNNDGSNFHRKMESSCLKSIVCNGTQITVGDFQSNKGKRKAQVTLDEERCCLKINKKNSLVDDINSKSFVPLVCRTDDISNSNIGKSPAAECSDDSDTKNYEFHGKKRSNKQQKLGLLASDRIDNHNEACGYEEDGHNEICCIKEAAFPFPDAKEHDLTCRNKSSDILINNQAAIVCLENMIPEDFMKLLDLDDDAEEQKYRAARARPLSPTLPELESPSRRHSLDDYHASDGRCESKEEKLTSTIEPQNCHSASSSQGQLDPNPIPENINPCDSSEGIGSASLLMSSLEHSQLHLDGGVHVDLSSDTCALANQIKNALKRSHDSDLALKRHSRESCNPGVSYDMNIDNIPENRVGVDEENALAIEKGSPQAGINWKSRSSMKMETLKQMPLHKVNELKCGNGGSMHEHWGIHGCCVVFSSANDGQDISRILCARNAIIHDTSQGANVGFSLVMVLHALAANLDLSSKETACVLFSFLLCKVSSMIPVECAKYMDEDLSSMSELVIAEMDKVFDDNIREVFTATCLLDVFVSLIQDFLTARKVLVCGDASCEQSDLGTSYHLDNENRIWSLKTAGVTQLVAGSVILASISTMHDCVDILWQTSFQLIQMCQSDSHWILTAVHVFASICGVKFFSPTDQHLMFTAIKSLIFLLEKGEVTPDGDECPRFPLCMKCPFAEGLVCVDKVISSLLEDLQICIAGAANYQDSKELVTEYGTCQTHNGRDSQSNQFDGSSKECSVSCSLCNFVCQMDRNGVAGFCHFTDIVSLVDLFGIGIENGRCDQTDVEGLMFSLLTFLDMDRTQKNNLCVQLAAVGALLNLLPLDFREIIEGPLNISLITSQLVHVEHIRRWFHQLGEEQKAMSLRLFQNSDMKES